MADVRIRFDEQSLEKLINYGYKYFVLRVENEENLLYPFRSIQECIVKYMDGNLNGPNNMVMDLGDALYELAEGIPLLEAQVIVPRSYELNYN